MTKLTEKLYGAGLIALAFSLNAADVNAQTCTTAPSCATLGFNKSSSDCEGHSVLKCPFDQTKLYCDTGTTTATPTPTPTTPTYTLGGTYSHNGIPVGKIIELKDNRTHGTIATTGTYSGTFTAASSGCASLNAGGLTWFLPTDEQIKLIGTYVSKFDGYVWGSSGKCVNSSGRTYDIGCDWPGTIKCDGSTYYCSASNNSPHKDLDTSTYIQGYYCVAAF